MSNLVIEEYRGVEQLVYAEVTEDTSENYTTGEVKPLAGVAEISRTTESSSEVHYYDNIPAVTIESTGSDEITCSVSAIPLPVLAEITGQTYLEDTQTLVEGERQNKYFALGYIAEKTTGEKVLVWRYKGTFSIPDTTHNTKDDGTDANGQEITYTGISTTHKFTKTSKGAKAINTIASAVDDTKFFTAVTTPDTLTAKTSS